MFSYFSYLLFLLCRLQGVVAYNDDGRLVLIQPVKTTRVTQFAETTRPTPCVWMKSENSPNDFRLTYESRLEVRQESFVGSAAISAIEQFLPVRHDKTSRKKNMVTFGDVPKVYWLQ